MSDRCRMQMLVLTLFPDMFDAFWSHGIMRKAVEQGSIVAAAMNIRDFALDRHHVTDDRPYGGGSGMVMKPEPLAAAIRAARERAPVARTILMSPQGRVFDQAIAREMASLPAIFPGSWAERIPPSATRFPTDCSSTPTTHDRRCLRARQYPMCC